MKIAKILSATLCTAAFSLGAAEINEMKLSSSITLEAKSSINRGVSFLLKKQMPNGSWNFHPAMTSLCALSIANSPEAEREDVKEAVKKAAAFIRLHVQPDGSIWNKDSKEYPNYSTSVSLVTLAYLNDPQDKKIIKAARQFLMDSQFTDVSEDNASFGGIGYGKNLRPDLSNTQMAIEALYLTEDLDGDDPKTKAKTKKMWERARKFLTRCQNLAETNDQGWVTSDPENDGSFIYLPELEESKAGEITAKGGKKTLRGYGSMTYAGLKSMIYAEIKKDDVRVKAAYDWAMRNYTLNENPGMQQQGLFYYIQTFTKAMTAMEKDVVVDAKGTKHNWRYDLVKKLLSVQRGNGSWYNDEGRWWESVPELVTAYSLLSLEQAVGKDIGTIMKKQ